MYQAFVLASLLLVANAQSGLPDCPIPVSECPIDPCEGATCPRYLTADCEANLCHGLCTPNFIWRETNVTDRCPVRRCADIVCRGNRICIEEVVPSSCPDNEPQCRQFLNARCVLQPPITDCSLLECPEGMVCRNRRQREGVVCAIPRDCSQIECDQGFECVRIDRRAQCVQRSCTEEEQENCRSFEYVCMIVENGFASCFPPDSCEQIESCPRGQDCFILTNSDLTPSGNLAVCSSVHPSCDTLNCDEDSVCLTQGYPSVDIFTSTCFRRDFIEFIRPVIRTLTPCSEMNFCDPNSETCVESRTAEGTFIRSLCIPINCTNDRDCPIDEPHCLQVPPFFGIPFNSVCVPEEGMFLFSQSCDLIGGRFCPSQTQCSNILLDGQTVGTICDIDPSTAGVSSRGCEALDCNAVFPDGQCTLRSYMIDGIEESLAQCTPFEEARRFIENAQDLLGLTLGCDQFLCPRGTVCIEEFGSVFGSASGSSGSGGGSTTDFIREGLGEEGPFCIPSCDALDCESNFQVCEQVSETFARCVQPLSCTEALDRQCRMDGNVCDVVSGTVLCHPPERCDQLVDELECPLQQGCILRRSAQTPSGIAAICNDVTASCDTLNCDERSICASQGYPSLGLVVSICADIDGLLEFQRVSCSVRDFCDPFNEVCADFLRPGVFITSVCIDRDCIADGSGSTTGSTPYSSGESGDSGSASGESSGDFGSGISGDTSTNGFSSAGSDLIGSGCFPSGLDFEIGPSCFASGRVCPTGSFCTDIVIRGQLVGTTCDNREPTINSCNQLNCNGESGDGTGSGQSASGSTSFGDSSTVFGSFGYSSGSSGDSSTGFGSFGDSSGSSGSEVFPGSGEDCFQGFIDGEIEHFAFCTSEADTADLVQQLIDFLEL